MKMVLTNEGDADLAMFFYDIDYTVGDRHSDEALYFHAHFRRERPTSLRQDYEIVPRLAGRGRFLGANIGVMPDTGKYGRSWWGEENAKFIWTGTKSFLAYAAPEPKIISAPVGSRERSAICTRAATSRTRRRWPIASIAITCPIRSIFDGTFA